MGEEKRRKIIGFNQARQNSHKTMQMDLKEKKLIYDSQYFFLTGRMGLPTPWTVFQSTQKAIEELIVLSSNRLDKGELCAVSLVFC